MIKLRKQYEQEIQEIISKNIEMIAKQNKHQGKIIVMCNPNIISLANGNLEKELKESFASRIQSMKRLEYGMATH